MSRTTARRPTRLPSFVGGSLLCILAGQLQAQIMYTVTEIASPDGFPLTVTAISEAGHVTGFANTDQAGPYGLPLRRAFLWSEGIWTELGTLGGKESAAYGVNAAGQIVGVSSTAADEPHGVLWLPSPAYGLAAGLHDLCPGEGCECYAQDINESGQVLGAIAGESRAAFLWLPKATFGLPQGFSELSLPIGGAAPIPRWGSECAINNEGRLAFGSHVWLPTPAYGRPAGWSTVDVRIMSGDEWVTVRRITGQDHVLVEVKPFYEDHLCDLTGDFCCQLDDGFRPMDINDRDDRVGSARELVEGVPVGPIAAAVRFTDGDTENRFLKDRLFPHTGWYLRFASVINNARQIAGTGVTPDGRDSAYRLDPVDADLNDDASVDLSDYPIWRRCLGGPGVEAPFDCAAADLNFDGVVDLVDAIAIQRVFTRSP